MNGTRLAFSFGRNWRDFINTSLSEERIREAMKSLAAFLRTERLDGLTFLDVGCGSGLFSLAACRMGAKKIISLDIDPLSVSCCEYLREKEGLPQQWFIYPGSILDMETLAKLDKADIVYAWGVLHHTGNMWAAIRNVIGLVRPGGILFIAIYNRVEGPFGSESWLKLKRAYNMSPFILRSIIEYCFLFLVIAKMILTLKNPFKVIKEYEKKRGMSLRTDIRDSLGGYPYEHASPEEVFLYCREHGLVLENIKTVNTLELNEFLFRKLL